MPPPRSDAAASPIPHAAKVEIRSTGIAVRTWGKHFVWQHRHSMFFGMATAKITITLQREQVQAIRALVTDGRSGNVSAFVQHAVGVALFDAAGWREMLEDALRQTGGPLTKKDRDWADILLSGEKQKRGIRKGKAS